MHHAVLPDLVDDACDRLLGVRVNGPGLATLLLRLVLALLLCGKHLLSLCGDLLSTHLCGLLVHAWIVTDVCLGPPLLLDGGRVDKVVVWVEEGW